MSISRAVLESAMSWILGRTAYLSYSLKNHGAHGEFRSHMGARG